eukprot:GHVR01047153.1.p1 GENE.GHVR01047153.1~~GHVR01047153.1.p1  ORF type:complete len:211 (+),score=34.80 GHVR01047153.1:137-769(+)
MCMGNRLYGKLCVWKVVCKGNRKGKSRAALTDAEIAVFLEETHFNPAQISKLHETFRAIAATRDDDGVIDIDEFCLAVHVAPNEISRQLFRSFDLNEDGVLNFREYLWGLSTMALGNEQEKLSLAFKLYDIDRDGSISREDLTTLCKACTDYSTIDDQAISRLVDETLRLADLDGNGLIDFSEFKTLASKQPELLQSLSLGRHALRSITP